ncbi:MAG: hypothetical protein ACE5FM_08405 [Methyloligellaceae bacterium]
MTKVLTEAEILGADDLKRELVSVPEWGGHVYVRTMTGSERDQFETDVSSRNSRSASANMRNIRAKLCALVMVDADGKCIVSPAKVEALGGKSAAALDRVFTVAMRLNGLSGEDVEELAGNSESGRND